ncbi:helix-turn-helix transcriptional regulator [Sediminibacterium sp.]|uniref:helix-turn-helix transcriptional regulator n=1 Tax=Sediminibacterium sp. TaxID=1917865 RepID=UPI0025FB08C0|nr:helix-turn-helix transcriptional regulator [Sediminibacterium sp.]MBW0177883.1 helix-turn-helix transcriptional regulator [Sediminibacterium sp.]
MDYQTYLPQEDLAAFIKCYWTLSAPASSTEERQRIVPDGCMEMIFHAGDLYRQYLPDATYIMQPRCFVFGQITQPLEIAATGQTKIFAVRFHPEGFLPFINMLIREMDNKAISLERLFGDKAAAFGEAVCTAKEVEEQISLVENFLLQQLQNQETSDRIAASSVQTLLALKGQLSVDELAGQLQVHRRQLERKFATVIGLSPKQLAKIIRLQATLKMMGEGQYDNLTELAYENGYFDQAHFIKDFKEFTGVTPGEFYADQLKMSHLFSGS